MEKKLQVNDLKISFRTNNGKVQAVRDISFDLNKGETLAIVGESGSGKSVTARAILGILAGNSIVENGEIIYDGKDLLKISEEDFHAIRGDKIAMIFQDPMSSLNPIVKIGKQLTEAMILKNRLNRRENKRKYNAFINNMLIHMDKADPSNAALHKDKIDEFKKFEFAHIQLEGAYSTALNNINDAIAELKALIFSIEKNFADEVGKQIKHITSLVSKSSNTYLIPNTSDLVQLLTESKKASSECVDKKNYHSLLPNLTNVQKKLESATLCTKPNFFAMGYYVTFVSKDLPEGTVEQINPVMEEKLESNFMKDFNVLVKMALKNAYVESMEAKKVAVKNLGILYNDLSSKDVFDKKETKEKISISVAFVENTINKLLSVKESTTHTYRLAMKGLLNTYFGAARNNAKETARFTKEQTKFDKLKAKGRPIYWKPSPANIIDIDLAKKNILNEIKKVISAYQSFIDENVQNDYDKLTSSLLAFLQETAAGTVYKVTQSMAKNTAIKIMEEVGIPEARKRYNQYPFEFSGGMRQRIVIAIALSANPDILICDEPTTALDVTIQSQILELINELKEKHQLSIIFITHDLGVVANMADRIAVMYAGKIVEYGNVDEIFYEPKHPYTWALLSSMPDLETKEKLEPIPGTPPNMIYPPVGDAFAIRNKYAMKIDFEEQPPLFKVSDTHYASTWLLHPDAPKVEPPLIVTERIERMKKAAGKE